MPLYKDFFHKHSYDDIKYRVVPTNFKIRFEKAFGYYHERVYSQTKRGKARDYRTPWILLEDTQENADRFAWVFHNFNIYISLNHYRGKEVTKECYVDLAFDFDAPDLEAARQDTLKMAELLENKQVPYSLFFSGKKGFHIMIGYQVFGQEHQENNHLVNKEIAKLLQQQTGPLNSLDMAIYSSRRQLRLAGSKHSGSGLFKIPITLDELAADPDSILKLAQKPRDNFSLPILNGQNDSLHNVYLQAQQNLARLSKYDVPDIDLGVLKGSYPPCIDECLSVGIKDGAKANRNETTMFLASFFKGRGLDMRITQDKLVAHALGVLKPFSASSATEIKSSTKTCVVSVYRSPKYKFNCHFARGKFKLRCDDTCQLNGKYKDVRSSRKLHYIKVKQPEPVPTYTIEEIREGICEQIDTYLADPQGKILLIKVPAGVGKTVTTLKHISFGKGRIFWVSGRKDMFENIPYGCQFKWKQILGRHSGRYDKKGKLLVEPNCKHAELAHVLGDKNHNINRRLCRKHCDVAIEDCDYFRQFHDLERHWFVQQPFFFYPRDSFLDPFDVVVIDEDVLDAFKRETQIIPEDVRQNRQLFKTAKREVEQNNKMIRDYYAYHDKEPPDDPLDSGHLNPVIKLLSVIDLIGKSDIPFGTSESGKLLLDKIKNIAEEKLGEDIEGILKAIDDPSVFDKEINFDLKDEGNIPLNFFSYLYEILYFEVFKKHPQNNLSRLFFQKERSRTKRGGSVCLENVLLLNKIEKDTQKPIIILDATGKKILYENLFGREVIEYAPQVKLENEIIQVHSALNSKQSLSIKSRLQRYIEAIKKVLAWEPNTLVVCKETFKDQVIEQLPKSVQVVHFYGLRGSNEYQDFKQVVILGAPQGREEDIKKFGSVMFYKEQRTVNTGVEYRYRPYMALAKDGLAPATKIRIFCDTLLQAINEVYREDEILQGLNRIRIAQDPTKRVILLTNLPIPGLPITKLVSLEELCGAVSAQKLVDKLARLSVEKLGFTGYYDIVDPLLNKSPLMGKTKAEQATKWLKTTFTLDFNVSPENKFSERTLRTYFPKAVAGMGLRRLKLISESKETGRRYLDLYGHDAKAVETILRSKWSLLEGDFRVEEYSKA